MTRKHRLTVSIDPEVVERAKEKKRKTGRPLSHVCETALREWVEDDCEKQDQSEDT